jgi:hypothetical protein
MESGIFRHAIILVCPTSIRIPTLKSMLPQIEMLRRTSPVRKLVLLGLMNLTVKTLALSGLKTRFPEDTPEMLRRRLADLILGPELALKVYGPFPPYEK